MEKQTLYISNFNKFLLKIFLTSLTACVLFSYFFEKSIVLKTEISGASKINRILNQNHKYEIPIFGTSRSEQCYIPSIINNSNNSFNYGIPGIGSNIWIFFLEKELEKQKSTPIIINFDLRGFTNSVGDVNSYIPNYNEVKHLIPNHKNVLYEIPFIKYYGSFVVLFKYYLNEKFNFTKLTDNGGSFYIHGPTKENFDLLVEKRKSIASSFKYDFKLSKKFNNLIASTDRKIYIVIAPYHKSYFYNFKNLPQFEGYLRKLRDIENVEIIDLRHFIKDDSLFLDTSHLKWEGAKKFSHQLSKIINKI